MSIRGLLLAALGLTVSGLCHAVSSQPAIPEKPGLVEHACWFAAADESVASRCYWMFVHEEHGNAASPVIGFPVIRLSRGDSVRPPVLHLGGGGPGNAMAFDAEHIDATWQNHQYMSLEAGMDLVMIDPRGVGRAIPRLSCDEWLHTVRDTWREPLSLEREWAIGLAADRRCVRRLSAAGVNPAMYNSAAVARDVEALRQALGVNQWNLYGVSYGSRYALTIARDFPHSVAAMVLDGVVFPHLRYEEHSARTSEQAMRRAFAWCENKPACRDDFPDIEARFWAVAEALNKRPLSITITDPQTFEPLPLSLTGYRLFAVMFHAAYDETHHGRFPALVKSLEYRNTDLIAPFLRQYLGYLLDPSDSDVALATHYCYEEHPFVNGARMLQAARGFHSVIRDPLVLNASTTRDWCRVWLDGVAAPASEGEPIVTDVPTLILHGALDPVLPVEDIRAQLANFRHAELLTYPDIAHDVVSASFCAEATAGAFFRDGLSAIRQASCGSEGSLEGPAAPTGSGEPGG